MGFGFWGGGGGGGGGGGWRVYSVIGSQKGLEGLGVFSLGLGSVWRFRGTSGFRV